ncbi:MAG: hypothetical protein L0Z50_01745 [Verrucomicrobiales bacterium]|nr:hypothetical protein [Verrucomicrobiales bacterium]
MDLVIGGIGGGIETTATSSAVLFELGAKRLVLCALACLAHFYLARRSASLCHSMWTLSMTGLLLLPVFSTLLPSWSLPLKHPRQSQMKVQTPAFSGSARLASETAFESVLEKNSNVTPSESRRADAKTGWFNAKLFVITWIGGTLFLLVRTASGHVLARQIARSDMESDRRSLDIFDETRQQLGIARQVRVVKSPNAIIPMTFGLLHPVVLVPLAMDLWTEERCRIVWRHELAHVRRLDCLADLIATLVCALFWINPLIWFGARLMSFVREQACDDMVVAAGTRPSVYARHLLAIAQSARRWQTHGLAVVSMAKPSNLEQRIRLLLRIDHGMEVGRVTWMTCFCSGVLLVLGISGCHTANAPASLGVKRDLRTHEIAFVKGEWGTADRHVIWLASEIGTTNRADMRLAAGEVSRGESSPNFSPYGKSIAFGVFVGGRHGIVIRDLKTGHERELPTDLEECDSPFWSPDGKRIAFVGWVNQRSSCHIFVVNSDGSNLRKLTEGEGFNWGPAWSPDGRKIAWERQTPQDPHDPRHLRDECGRNEADESYRES